MMNTWPMSCVSTSPVRSSRQRTRSSCPSPSSATICVCVRRTIAGILLDAANQIARHRVGQARPAHQHVDAPRRRREEDGRLPGGIAAADDDDLLADAQLRLHRRRAVVDAGALEGREVLERRLPVLGAGRDDHRARRHATVRRRSPPRSAGRRRPVASRPWRPSRARRTSAPARRRGRSAPARRCRSETRDSSRSASWSRPGRRARSIRARGRRALRTRRRPPRRAPPGRRRRSRDRCTRV